MTSWISKCDATSSSAISSGYIRSVPKISYVSSRTPLYSGVTMTSELHQGKRTLPKAPFATKLCGIFKIFSASSRSPSLLSPFRFLLNMIPIALPFERVLRQEISYRRRDPVDSFLDYRRLLFEGRRELLEHLYLVF